MKKLVLLLLTVILVTGVTLSGACASLDSSRTLESVTPQAAYALILENPDNPDFVIVDVRTPEEFDDGHLNGAINIDFYSPTFRDEINRLAKDKTYVIYCRSGNRSGQALSVMYDLGFQEVYNVLDGIVRWQAEGLPVVK